MSGIQRLLLDPLTVFQIHKKNSALLPLAANCCKYMSTGCHLPIARLRITLSFSYSMIAFCQLTQSERSSLFSEIDYRRVLRIALSFRLFGIIQFSTTDKHFYVPLSFQVPFSVFIKHNLLLKNQPRLTHQSVYSHIIIKIAFLNH